MRFFVSSIIVSVLATIAAYTWGGLEAVAIGGLLTLMEVSFSFDNAVVNATVLKTMNAKWRKRFMTWGMLIAVFGMRLVFPILIVALATGLGLKEVGVLAVEHPEEYSRHVLASHTQISAFGGAFLLLVFLKFFVDEHKQLHWFRHFETKLARMGKLESIELVLVLIILLALQFFLEESHRLEAINAGVIGIALYVIVNGVTALLGNPEEAAHTGNALAFSSLSGFIYLQFLDASFSLDGVIGAFAISNDIVIIMLGLGVGAMYVRSITLYLVYKGTLDKYRYLEHGAHYGIGALAAIMLISTVRPVPEVVTGLVGVVFIALALVASVRHNRRHS